MENMVSSLFFYLELLWKEKFLFLGLSTSHTEEGMVYHIACVLKIQFITAKAVGQQICIQLLHISANRVIPKCLRFSEVAKSLCTKEIVTTGHAWSQPLAYIYHV